MKRENGAKSLNRRIREGAVDRQDVARRLAELAFGKVNDCVRLVLEENPDIKDLDLSLLCEVKKTEKGSVEIKLIDRLEVLQQLVEMTSGSNGEMDAFLQALQGGETV